MSDTLPDVLRDIRTLAVKFKNQAASSIEARSRRDYLAGTHDGLMEAVNRIEAAMKREDADESPPTLFAARKR